MSHEAPIVVTPATESHLELLAHDEAKFANEFGLRVAPGYLEFPEALEQALHSLRAGAPPEWATHLFIHRADAALIGLGGYTHAPVDGGVEIGYGIAPGYRGRGYATEAARQLVDKARAAGLDRVIAHTLAEPGASTRVLQHLGFRQVAEMVDPEDGPVWRWELALT
jgi:RimJ/RimL family protein N-acetyltransferase